MILNCGNCLAGNVICSREKIYVNVACGCFFFPLPDWINNLQGYNGPIRFWVDCLYFIPVYLVILFLLD